MEPVRPLRDLFAALSDEHPATADPSGWLAAHGYDGLPPHLVAEAIVNYADAAPVEVAEHLAPFVTAHSGVPPAEHDTGTTAHADLDHGFALLAAAPADLEEAPDHLAEAGPVDTLDGGGFGAGEAPGGHPPGGFEDHFDDHFGTGDAHGVEPGAEGAGAGHGFADAPAAHQGHDLGVDHGLGFEHDPGWGIGLDEPLFTEHSLDEHGFGEHPFEEHPFEEHSFDEHGLDEGPGDDHPADDAGHPGL